MPKFAAVAKAVQLSSARPYVTGLVSALAFGLATCPAFGAQFLSTKPHKWNSFECGDHSG